jgi:hypothetical protein
MTNWKICTEGIVMSTSSAERDMEKELSELRTLLKSVVKLVHSCHDCIRYKGDEELKQRIQKAIGEALPGSHREVPSQG